MEDEDRPIAWLALEKGTTVRAADGDEIGVVSQVIGDEQKDIFSGITITSGLFGTERYAPADLVDAITRSEVRLSLGSRRAAEALDAYSA